MANFMLYIGMHSMGTCASLLQLSIIIIIIIIINPKETQNGTQNKIPRETLKKP